MTLQDAAFHWVSREPGTVGGVILIGGLVCGFFGHRLFGGLLVLGASLLGWLGGLVAGELTGVPAAALGAVGVVLCGGVAALWRRAGVVVSCGGTWALMGAYLSGQIGLKGLLVVCVTAALGLLGALFAYLCYRTMTVVLTTLQGAALIVVGFVGLSHDYLPSVGATLMEWSHDYSLLSPVLIAMIFVTAYSYQQMTQQGDIRTGASAIG